MGIFRIRGEKADSLRHLVRALHSRNYRLFVAGQSVSLVGTWMQQVAMSWLVYRLTGSAMLLGVIGFTSQIPTLFISPIAGVLADRLNRRRLLIATQMLAMVQALFLAATVIAGTVQVWQITLLSFVLGVVTAFDVPIRQSFVVEMVERREDLGNAIALNSSMVNGARLIGPSIAGLLVASAGEGVCFLINAASYLAVIIALSAMRIEPVSGSGRQRRHILHELAEGFSYAYRFEPIRNILLLVAVISFLGMPYMVLVPIFAKEVLHGGAHTFGFLMTSAGCGALCGTLSLALRRSVLGLDRMIVNAMICFASGIALLALSESFVFSMFAMMLAGFGGITVIASCNTILQTILDEDKRGRVMSFFTVAFLGATPFGSLGAGAMAGIVGPRDTLLVGSVGCLLGAAIFSRFIPKMREKTRPIFRRLGIMTG